MESFIRSEEKMLTISSLFEAENGVYDPSLKHSYCVIQSSPCDERNANIGRKIQSDSSFLVDHKCRAKMLEWSFKMVDFFEIDRSIVSISTYYQDRFLSTAMGSCTLTCREKFRVASVTCLYIAIKLYIPHKWNVTAHAFSQLCRGTISGESIMEMELCILFALGWNVHPPIPLTYVELFLEEIICTIESESDAKLHLSHQDEDHSEDDSVLGDLILPSLSDSSTEESMDEECMMKSITESILDLVRYQVEVALQSVSFIDVRSSVVAFAALLNAIEGVMSENEAQVPAVSAFCHHSVSVLSKILSHFKVVTRRELDQVRSDLLYLVMEMPDNNVNKVLLSNNADGISNESSTKAMSPKSTTTLPIYTHWSHSTNGDHSLSPKSVLSKVCEMHCRCHTIK